MLNVSSNFYIIRDYSASIEEISQKKHRGLSVVVPANACQPTKSLKLLDVSDIMC